MTIEDLKTELETHRAGLSGLEKQIADERTKLEHLSYQRAAQLGAIATIESLIAKFAE
jgi:hypothetical protein